MTIGIYIASNWRTSEIDPPHRKVICVPKPMIVLKLRYQAAY